MIAAQRDHRFALNQPPNIYETIEGEVMVINLESGVYYSITGAGAVAWPLLIAGATADEIGASLAPRYDVDRPRLMREIDAFIASVRAENLVRSRPDAGPSPVPESDDDCERSPFPGFGFERFEDMQALLVIDPVHEVGDFGWPRRAPGPGDSE